MIWTTTRRAAVTTAVLLLSLAGCGTLDVSDPTAIQQSELENADGANLLRLDALRQLYLALNTETAHSAMLSDEIFADTPAIYPIYGMINYDELLDRRQSAQYESAADGSYSNLQGVRKAATLAMPGLRTYVGPARVGEMFAVRGYATLLLAEVYCPGFPLHEIVDLKPVYGGPLTTDQVFEHALADFDSAVAYAADSARIADWARVGRARALVGLGRFNEAGQAATSVPVLYAQYGEFGVSGVFQPNDLGRPLYTETYIPNVSVADGEGGNGLDFVSADDPRMKTTPGILAADGVTRLYTPDKYPNMDSDILMASGIEARLVEAEAALQAGDIPTWLAKLNEPRRSAWSTIVPAVTGALPDLDDPGTDAARVDLTFRERAFWLFGSAHRLGDLRRLVARYGRAAESVFPTGAYRLGDTYEVATSIPFLASSESPYNSAITGCTSR